MIAIVQAASLQASSGSPNPSTFLDTIIFNSATRAPGTIITTPATAARMAGVHRVFAVGDGVAGRILPHLRRLARLLPRGSPNRRAVDAALARMDVIPCDTVEEACGAADRIAPEHLSIQIRAPRRALRRLRNFGSLFL